MPNQTGPHALALIFITVSIDTIGFGIILPAARQLIMDVTGQGIGEASMAGGWLAFSYATAQFLCGPLIGNPSDRFGPRPVLSFSPLTFACDYAPMGVTPPLNWLFPGRIAAGIAGAAHTSADSYVDGINSTSKRPANDRAAIMASRGVGPFRLATHGGRESTALPRLER